ncbi:hypothetical protein B0T11DRAFT_336111 [Plectosphaerella cucumerina]|uniref:Uncharacterized protein n=1 Tax=Plectosphaerella cucumerina TaxID=40658 RepID=A0A8K0TT59_9PEZI|nr:hypothetical protein B0T11DRAFT_336111 [Plectosphaerella cucumerina]
MFVWSPVSAKDASRPVREAPTQEEVAALMAKFTEEPVMDKECHSAVVSVRKVVVPLSEEEQEEAINAPMDQLALLALPTVIGYEDEDSTTVSWSPIPEKGPFWVARENPNSHVKLDLLQSFADSVEEESSEEAGPAMASAVAPLASSPVLALVARAPVSDEDPFADFDDDMDLDIDLEDHFATLSLGPRSAAVSPSVSSSSSDNGSGSTPPSSEEGSRPAPSATKIPGPRHSKRRHLALQHGKGLRVSRGLSSSRAPVLRSAFSWRRV